MLLCGSISQSGVHLQLIKNKATIYYMGVHVERTVVCCEVLVHDMLIEESFTFLRFRGGEEEE